ncbi:MAG: DUF4433 domain-containing protein [Desulfobacterales bacterium]|uniref:DUF4433 domain-containing protein n=1 Tax=Candidatus Desulfatibia vada TaxID=2841696 RepID=A0A8J6P254_9BACT|nr:DUF4433 domain-containing protein [Candidatus Desulfatibia vada]MBL6970859.1 DUF4433 domain-containing protein [Desulfobacterales bacterium]
MAIPDKFKHLYVYHFTHIDNLPGIVEHGLLSTNESNRLGIEYYSVALSDIQSNRATMPVTCGNGGIVHDYVPLYFCKRSSMLLYLVRNKVVDQQFVIYFEFPILIMNDYPSVFCDAAANTRIPPNFYSNFSDLEQLNWEAIDNLKWSMPNDRLKQERMAELLIHRRIDKASISRIIVWNDSIKKYVLECYDESGFKAPPIGLDPIHYFIDFYRTGQHSIATGPYFIKKKYRKTIRHIVNNIGAGSKPKFNKLKELRNALRKDFSILPETAELVELESDNIMHEETVGTHSVSVVKNLMDLPEFKAMNSADKLLAEIAAFLHDIGKGPKSRWDGQMGRQQVDHDHPIRALPMLERILTEDVATMKKRSARVICKLICYHDIVGDIVSKRIGRGRQVKELINIVDDERDLDMLIAIGKADMMSVSQSWVDHEEIDRLRSIVAEEL